tara:strand:- start:3715 stop:4419 length:705 start_codon:yes stop_codon:yes gene_type:complete
MAELDVSRIDLCGLRDLDGNLIECSSVLEPDYLGAQIAALLLLIAAIGFAVYALNRIGFFSFLNRERRRIIGGLTGWFIWILCVFSYTMLFESRIDFWLWATLPPICALSIITWAKHFAFRQQRSSSDVVSDSYKANDASESLTDLNMQVIEGPSKSESIPTIHYYLMLAVGFVSSLTFKFIELGPNITIVDVSESLGGGFGVLLIGWLFVRFGSIETAWITVAAVIALAYIGR